MVQSRAIATDTWPSEGGAVEHDDHKQDWLPVAHLSGMSLIPIVSVLGICCTFPCMKKWNCYTVNRGRRKHCSLCTESVTNEDWCVTPSSHLHHLAMMVAKWWFSQSPAEGGLICKRPIVCVLWQINGRGRTPTAVLQLGGIVLGGIMQRVETFRPFRGRWLKFACAHQPR